MLIPSNFYIGCTCLLQVLLASMSEIKYWAVFKVTDMAAFMLCRTEHDITLQCLLFLPSGSIAGGRGCQNH